MSRYAPYFPSLQEDTGQDADPYPSWTDTSPEGLYGEAPAPDDAEATEEGAQ